MSDIKSSVQRGMFVCPMVKNVTKGLIIYKLCQRNQKFQKPGNERNRDLQLEFLRVEYYPREEKVARLEVGLAQSRGGVYRVRAMPRRRKRGMLFVWHRKTLKYNTRPLTMVRRKHSKRRVFLN